MTDKKTEASSFQPMLEEHRELMQRIHELRQHWAQVDEAGGPQDDELGRRLDDFRRHLAAHFEEEERDGYLASALAIAPRFSRQAEQLCAQHRQLLVQLDGLMTQLSSAQSDPESWERSRRQFEDFVAELRKHEGAENAIVQSAFGDDIPSAD